MGPMRRVRRITLPTMWRLRLWILCSAAQVRAPTEFGTFASALALTVAGSMLVRAGEAERGQWEEKGAWEAAVVHKRDGRRDAALDGWRTVT
jgi:hypothetical protein